MDSSYKRYVKHQFQTKFIKLKSILNITIFYDTIIPEKDNPNSRWLVIQAPKETDSETKICKQNVYWGVLSRTHVQAHGEHDWAKGETEQYWSNNTVGTAASVSPTKSHEARMTLHISL